MPTPAKNEPYLPSPKEKSGERAIWCLYLLFFIIWLAGYWLGLQATAETSTFTAALAASTAFVGLPGWFIISCLWAFFGVVIALFYVSRRFFS